MSRNNWLAMLGVVLLTAGACLPFATAKESDTVAATTATTAASADNSTAVDATNLQRPTTGRGRPGRYLQGN